jgi:hypothetical protein
LGLIWQQRGLAEGPSLGASSSGLQVGWHWRKSYDKRTSPAAYFLTGKTSPRNEIKNQKFEYELIYAGFKFQSPELK